MLSKLAANIRVLKDKTYDRLINGKIQMKMGQDATLIKSHFEEGEIAGIEMRPRVFPYVGLYGEYYTFWNDPTYIIDNIYLGSAFNAASYQTLKKYNIKYI